MGFLERLRASTETSIAGWQSLTSMDQLDQIDQASNDGKIVIFKHSTTCGISAGAKHRLESEWGDLNSALEFYYLDLLSFRNISNEVAKRYKVRHESPQILVIKDGQAIHNNSHHRISITDLNHSLGL